jgi:hypothetical protein
MPVRHLPVRPDLDQLRRQARELLQGIRRGDAEALADLQDHHPEHPGPGAARLADAQLALARSYGVPSWPRLVLACRLIHAIWEDDVETVRRLVSRHPSLLHQMARGTAKCNWGPPLSYAANLGRDRIIAILRERGARDIQSGFVRACLQGRMETARRLHAMGARPEPGIIMGPAETQNGDGMALLLELGAEPADEHGDRLAPVALLLETYCRNARGKHRCLAMLAERGVTLPDTPTMAVHRGRTDLLADHLRRDPELLRRTFSHREIYPREVGCHEDETLALLGTPLAGGTLLHLAVEYDDPDTARWLLEHGADPNTRAAVDGGGWGGHTPLFHCTVTIPPGRHSLELARLLLEHGANPNARASLRKGLRFAEDETVYDYPDVTPLSWGRRFRARGFPRRDVLEALVAAGATE